MYNRRGLLFSSSLGQAVQHCQKQICTKLYWKHNDTVPSGYLYRKLMQKTGLTLEVRARLKSRFLNNEFYDLGQDI